MSNAVVWLILIVLLALTFDFINGFNDAANSIATSVTTKALSPRTAILMAAILDFAGALSSTAVARTIGKGVVDPHWITPAMVAAALLGSILWNLTTWWFGLPSSSSHALIGGLIGAVIAHNGFAAINIIGLKKILLGLFLTPLIGLTVGFGLMILLLWIFRRKNPFVYNERFRKVQILTSALTAFSHGTNDAQKSMGIITMALLAGGFIQDFHVPIWVVIGCALAMSLGTASGGWRIIRTMGTKITRIEPINGLAADLSSSAIIVSASYLGLPVSTSHVVSSSIMGTGSARRLMSVKWLVAKNMVTAWLITIPVSASLAAFFSVILNHIA